MNSKLTPEAEPSSEKAMVVLPILLTPKEAAHRLKLSVSWLAKARMRGDGPPYIQVGRAIRYAEGSAAAVDEEQYALVDQPTMVKQGMS